jgi:hypothetical protein
MAMARRQERLYLWEKSREDIRIFESLLLTPLEGVGIAKSPSLPPFLKAKKGFKGPRKPRVRVENRLEPLNLPLAGGDPAFHKI